MWIYCQRIDVDVADRHRGAQIPSHAAQQLARTVLAEHGGVSSFELQFSVGPHGKPELDWPESLHYNLSHSDEWIVCAVDKTAPIGVDIERIREAHPRVAKRFFHPREQDFLRQQPESERLGAFFNIWTAKESFVKALGYGIGVRLDSFSVDTEGVVIVDDPTVFADHAESAVKGWRVQHLAVDPAYRLAVCAQSADAADLVIIDAKAR
jgi:4'-phosphopantetheinyl transferase